MSALLLGASLALSGLFWGWALQTGGAALDPRTAARIFGWLCLASVAVGFVFALRRKTAYDKPSAALAGALATTLLTGTAMLYLSYFEWGNAAVSPARSARVAMTTAREVDPPPLPIPASLPAAPKARPATPTKEARHVPVVKTAPVVNTAALAKTAAVAGTAPVAARGTARAAGPCSGLKDLAQHQCTKCSNESGLLRFVCEENARAAYCTGRDGSEPGCPWQRSATMTD